MRWNWISFCIASRVCQFHAIAETIDDAVKLDQSFFRFESLPIPCNCKNYFPSCASRVEHVKPCSSWAMVDTTGHLITVTISVFSYHGQVIYLWRLPVGSMSELLTLGPIPFSRLLIDPAMLKLLQTYLTKNRRDLSCLLIVIHGISVMARVFCFLDNSYSPGTPISTPCLFVACSYAPPLPRRHHANSPLVLWLNM